MARLNVIPLTILAGCLTGGCIMPIPHNPIVVCPRPGLASEKDAGFVRPGVTRREEVLLRLGEPDISASQDRVFVYGCTTSGMTIVWGFAYQGVGDFHSDEIRDVTCLLIRFNDLGIVQQCEARAKTDRKLVPYCEELARQWAQIGQGNGAP